MPCYRCGVRQTDPSRGESAWRRGVHGDRLVLVCPQCQQAADWTAALDRCERCASTHLIRRLGQVECLDCDYVHSPDGHAAGDQSPDPALAEEVSRALERLLGRN